MNSRALVSAIAAAVTSGVTTTQAAAADAANQQLEEVIVTAEHREVSVLKTPVSVTALSGETLAERGILNTAQLGDAVPSVDIHTTNDGIQVTVRGITSNDATEKGDPSAAVMFDGVYIARTQAQETGMYDVSRVEVLRGPQGTLWGRNTTAGLVNIITNRPTHKFGASANVGVGNFNAQHLDAMLNLPVSDSMALRFSAASDKRNSYLIQKDPPGFTSSFSDDPAKKNDAVRAQLLWDANANLSLLLRFDYSTLKGAEGASAAVSANNEYVSPTLPATPPAKPILVDAKSPTPDSDVVRTRNYALTDAHQNDRTWGINPELNWKSDNFQLAYVGSYRKFRRDDGFPLVVGAPFSIPAFFIGDYQQNSQELRLATTANGPFEGQAGLYYFKEQSDIALWIPNLIPHVPFFGFPQSTDSQSKALFGQGTYAVTPTLKVTAGIRYTKDDKQRLGATAYQQTLTYNAATDTRALNWAEIHNTKTTWRAGLEYSPSAQTMLYVSAATGYKAGGFGDGCEAGVVAPNGVLCNQVNTHLYYQPENLTAYEVGVKGKLVEHLTYSVAAFKYDYKDMQLSSLGQVGNGPSLVTQNAGKAHVNGLEVEAAWAPAPHHHIDASLSLLEAKYDRYLGGSASTTDFSGYNLDHSPGTAGSLGYAYRYPLAAGGSLSASARMKYSADYYLTDYSNAVQFNVPSYTKFDVALTFGGPGDRWYVSAYGRNLNDRVFPTQISFFGGSWSMMTSEPKTYGLNAGFKY